MILLLLFSINSQATNLTIKVAGKKIEYISSDKFSVGSQNDDLAISSWKPEVNMFPTTDWYPSFKPMKEGATFSNRDGTSFNVANFAISGIEMKSDGKFKQGNESSTIGARCSFENYYGDVVTLKNQSNTAYCSLSKFMTSIKGIGYTPYYFVRPIVNLGSLVSELDGLSSGRYSATVPYNYRIYYRLKNGVLTWLNLSKTLHVTVDYQASRLTSIDVKPKGALDIILKSDNVSNTFSGEGVFDIKATGLFPTGLKMTLATSNKYLLYHTKKPNEFNIPFSVTCDNCKDQTLIDNAGNIIVNDTVVAPPSPNATELNFKLIIGIDDLDKNKTLIGDYAGNFSALFRPNI